MQNVFILKAKLKMEREISTPSARYSSLLTKVSKLPHHPMKIHMNFEIEGMCMRKTYRIQ